MGVIENSPVLEESIMKEDLSEVKLWNPKYFLVLSFFFSFLPAAILYALNYGRLGMTKKRNNVLIVSIIVFITFILLVIFAQTPSYFILGLNIGLGFYMQRSQKTLFDTQQYGGGKKASYIVPIIGSLLLVFAIIYFEIISDNIPEDSIYFNDDQIYYTRNVDINEAIDLGECLKDTKFFADDGQDISIKMDKTKDKYIISIVIDKKDINNELIIQFCRRLREYVVNNVFITSKVDVNMCDNYFNILRVVSD